MTTWQNSRWVAWISGSCGKAVAVGTSGIHRAACSALRGTHLRAGLEANPAWRHGEFSLFPFVWWFLSHSLFLCVRRKGISIVNYLFVVEAYLLTSSSFPRGRWRPYHCRNNECICYSLHSFNKWIILIHFSRAFAEAHTFEIRCGAFWFVAWGVVVVGISQIREVVGGDSFCGFGWGFFCGRQLGAELCTSFPALGDVV